MGELQLHGAGRRRRRQNLGQSKRAWWAQGGAEGCGRHSEWSVGTPAAGATRCHCPVGCEPLHQRARRASRPAQQGAASLYRSSGQARLKPELASIFLISFQGRPGSGHARVFLLCSCPILQSTRPSLPSQELPTSHAHSYRNIGQSLLAGRLHPLRASSPGVPDATMHATVHTHHLGNSSSTQPRPTSPSATTLL